MPYRWDDCHCEDYPCCGHYDESLPEPDYCDQCGWYHTSAVDCGPADLEPDEYDDEEEIQ